MSPKFSPAISMSDLNNINQQPESLNQTVQDDFIVNKSLAKSQSAQGLHTNPFSKTHTYFSNRVVHHQINSNHQQFMIGGGTQNNVGNNVSASMTSNGFQNNNINNITNAMSMSNLLPTLTGQRIQSMKTSSVDNRQQKEVTLKDKNLKQQQLPSLNNIKLSINKGNEQSRNPIQISQLQTSESKLNSTSQEFQIDDNNNTLLQPDQDVSVETFGISQRIQSRKQSIQQVDNYEKIQMFYNKNLDGNNDNYYIATNVQNGQEMLQSPFVIKGPILKQQYNLKKQRGNQEISINRQNGDSKISIMDENKDINHLSAINNEQSPLKQGQNISLFQNSAIYDVRQMQRNTQLESLKVSQNQTLKSGTKLNTTSSQPVLRQTIALEQKSEQQRLKEVSESIQKDQRSLFMINRLKDSFSEKFTIYSKSTQMVFMNDYENIFKLINNPFMEMRDVKCEFHQIMKNLNKENIGSVDLDSGQWNGVVQLEDRTSFITEGQQYPMELICYEISGYCLNSNKKYMKLNSCQIPFKYLPFLYFLKNEDMQEVIMQCINVVEEGIIRLDEQKMYTMLKTYDPVPHKNEMKEFCFTIYSNSTHGKSTNLISVNYFSLKKFQVSLKYILSHVIISSIIVKSLPMMIEVQQQGNEEFKTVITFEIPFSEIIKTFKYLKSKSFNMNELHSKLMQLTTIVKDLNKEIVRIKIDFLNLQPILKYQPQTSRLDYKKSQTSLLDSQFLEEERNKNLVPSILLDNHIKLKFNLKDPVIKYMSSQGHTKEGQVIQKELKWTEIIHMIESKFENWESSVFNPSHLM
ncbi:UNKNOWN [Stylonychia lemnae]|uniref:Uncharacterized protein n=1 Tax=Stylonychia lemnae TaxID=5949 RepID=A0A078AKP7_STYLE|nr:UNKNOWN [Stylonychia lemnae]|eukprot:CDW82466.1 UNKNOWN [Stylonychia lemnae]